MKKLTIYRLMMTESDCYRQGTIQTQVGVQVHSTGANNPYLKRYVQPDDGRLGKNIYNNSHNRPGGNVCASAYIGKLQDGTVAVYQTLPWDYRCWLSGSGKNGNANRMGYIGFEICEDNCQNADYFQQAVMEKSVLLTAHLCQMLGVTPWTVVKRFDGCDALAVMDHAALYRAGCGSNHGDIGLWLRKFGLTFEDYRLAVDEAMEEGVEVEYIDALDDQQEGENVKELDLKTIRRGDSGTDVYLLQSLLEAHGLSVGGIDGKFGAKTENALKKYQRAVGLADDGVCGANTWSALMEQDGGSGDIVRPDCVQIERLKLTEMEAAANLILADIKHAQGGDTVG